MNDWIPYMGTRECWGVRRKNNLTIINTGFNELATNISNCSAFVFQAYFSPRELLHIEYYCLLNRVRRENKLLVHWKGEISAHKALEAAHKWMEDEKTRNLAEGGTIENRNHST